MQTDARTETFYYVYELPERGGYSAGFAFNGGNQVQFLNVDWFSGYNSIVDRECTEEELRTFLLTKKYRRPEKRYLVLGHPGHTFVLEPDE